MKTKEFIKRVKELGFEVFNEDDYLVIKDEYESNVANVNKTTLSQMSTDYIEWDEIYDEDKTKLFDLLIEYAKTPIDERKEEEKYFYEHRFIKTRGGNPTYLAIRQRPNYKYPILQGSYKDIFEYKVEFTDKEMEETKKQYGIFLDDFVKKEIIEVSE